MARPAQTSPVTYHSQPRFGTRNPVARYARHFVGFQSRHGCRLSGSVESSLHPTTRCHPGTCGQSTALVRGTAPQLPPRRPRTLRQARHTTAVACILPPTPTNAQAVTDAASTTSGTHDLKSPRQHTNVIFTLQHAPTGVPPDGHVLLVGDGDLLGDWHLQHARQLRPGATGTPWTVEVPLKPGVHAFKVRFDRVSS